MEKELNDRVLMEMVFRCLCRVLKNKKIYHRFRCFVGHGIARKSFGHNGGTFNIVTKIYDSMSSMQCYIMAAATSDNPFFKTSCKSELFNTLQGMLGADIITEENNGDANKVQTRVMQLLNTLLHCCVEKAVGEMSEVENIGRETFEMICKEIYGDDFVDETEKDIPEEMKKMIESRRRHFREIPKDMVVNRDFLEFLLSKGVKLSPSTDWEDSFSVDFETDGMPF